MSKKIIDLDALKKFRQEADQRYVVEGEYSPKTKVGYADLAGNLDSKVDKNDVDAYIFRTSGGSLEIGDYCKEKAIVGGSLGWNQLFDALSVSSTTVHSVSLTNNNDGSFTINGTNDQASNTYLLSKDINVIGGQKHLIRGFGDGTTYRLYIVERSSDNSPVDQYTVLTDTIKTLNANTTKITYNVLIYGSQNVNNKRVWTGIYNLTAALGSTIADYINTLETNTTGAGVAWLRKYFPKTYYAYCAIGGFQSVKVSGKKNVGFNQLVNTPTRRYQQVAFDKTTFTRLIAGQTYNFEFSNITNATNWRPVFSFYDMSGNAVTSVPILGFSNSYSTSYNTIIRADNVSLKKDTFTPTIDCYVYVNFYYGDTSSSSVMENPCLHFAYDGERDGEYEPYEVNTYEYEPIDLIGIPKLDENGNLYFEGNRYNYDGTVDEEYDVYTFTGNETWIAWSSGYRAEVLTTPAKTIDQNDVPDMFSNTGLDVVKRVNIEYGLAPNGISVNASNIFVGNTSNLAGKSIIYKKATATQSSATPFQEVQKVNNWGTEEYLAPANDTRLVEVPVGHDTDYPLDCKSKIEIAPDLPENDGVYVCKVDSGVAEYVGLSTWLSDNGYVNQISADTIKENIGGTLRNVLAVKASLDFNNTAFVDLGTLTWTLTGTIFWATISDMVVATDNIICSKYKSQGYVNSSSNLQDKCVGTNKWSGAGGKQIIIKDSSYTDATTFKNAVKGVLLAYEKA